MSFADSYRTSDNRFPALVGAAMLHVGLFLAVTMWVHPSMIPVGSAVPITIVSSAPTTDTKPAEEAPQVQTAATETPAPEAQPAPPPVPTPAKPTPAKAAPPTPPTKPSPIPQKPVPPKPVAKPTPSFDLDALQASISRAAHAAPAKPSAAPRGPTRAETDLHARPDAGRGVSQSQLEGLQQLLGRLWNPNCQVEGGENIRLKLAFTVAIDGRVAGSVSAGGAEHSSDPVTGAAARRAIDAVHQVEPYAEPYRGQRITVNFNAKEVCSNR